MNQHLARFMDDFSNGGAIRHLADQNLSVSEITRRLSFPMDQAKVASMVWKYYLEIGKIRLEPPREDSKIEKVTYVEEYNRNGIPSLIRKSEWIDVLNVEYILCEFGKERYQDESFFLKKLERLNKREREFIQDLPWPLQQVYYRSDEWICGIMRKWKCE